MDQLIYEDNNGAQIPISSPAVTLGVSSWHYTHAGNLPVGNHTISVRDPFTGTLVTSNSFAVVTGHTIAVGTVTGAVAGTVFTFTGSLGGYGTTVPGLTYTLVGPKVGASAPTVSGTVTGVTANSWSMPFTITASGSYTFTVTDGTVLSAALNFTVASVTVNHVITPVSPIATTAGATFTFSGALAGYTTPPSLTYTLNNSLPQTVTGVTNTSWSMALVAPTTAGSYNLAITDGTTSGIAVVNVAAAAKVITPLAPSGAVAGQSFTFTGVLSGYTTIPALTYTLSPSGSPVTMTGVSITGWAMTITISTAASYTVTVSDDTVHGITSFVVSNASTTLRNFYESPGQDGSFWVQPFQNSANWITSGPLVTALRGGTPSVNTTGNYAPPWYIGKSTDPQVTVTDGTHSIVVHVPLGAIVEGPASPFDQSIGGSDATQPYLIWSISGANINTGSVAASGSVITGSYGFAVQDGAGLMMVDAVTGAPGDNNSFGNIQDFELANLTADPNYIIQHMLAFQLDIGQASSAGPIWPLLIIDGGAVYTGSIPQGTTAGIPANVSRPPGQTRGFYALWDCFQQFGGFNYNFGATGGINIVVNSFSGAYASLISQIVTAWPTVAQSLCILNYTNGVSGAQYSLATTKGAIPGSTNAFPAPAPLNLAPTGNKNVAPSTFGAWYPSGYNVTPTNTPNGGSSFIISPTAPINVVAGTPFTFTGVLSGYATVPTLTYTVGAAAPTTLPGVTLNGWSATLTISTPGSVTVVVTDATNLVTGSVSFSVASTTPTQNPVTWNPADIITATLSNNNYTATATGSTTPYGNPQGVRATTALSTSQVLIWEVTFPAITQNAAVGVASTGYALNLHAGLGGDTTAIGAYPSTGTGSQPAQTVYYNAAQLTAGNGVSSAAPFTVTLAVNGTNLYFSDPAMRSTSGVSWNNSTTADPVRNIGGLSFSGVALPYYPVFATGEGGTIATLNDGTAAFSAFAASYIAANPSAVTLSGQVSTSPTKAITPNVPAGVVVNAAFTFSGSLTGYTSIPTLTYSLNGAAAVALNGVTQTGWSSTIVTSVSGTDTIVVSDGSISNQVSFSVSTSGGSGNRVVAPLTGSVPTGTWLLNQRFNLANSPSELGYMQYNVLLPAQYNPSLLYPLLLVGHPNDDGMNGGSYPRDGASYVTGAAYGGSYSLDTMYNSTVFRTAHPCIIVSCQIDQSIDLSGSNGNANGGGYNDSQNSGWNENAVNGVIAAVISQYPIDPSARYTIGYSLGGIQTLAYLADNNQYNGPGLKIWTAGITYSDQLFRPSTPNANIYSRMASVPLLTISTSSDNNPASYDQPAWHTYTDLDYPTQSAYDNGGMPAIRAGSTNYYYINYGSANPATTFMPMNALGGDGDKAYAWLFSQTSGSAGPTITGVAFTPASTVVANSANGTVAGTLLAGSSSGALTGITYSISPTGNFAVSGANVTFATSFVAAGTYPLTVTVSATNAGNSPQSYTINITVAPVVVGPGVNFSVSGGKVLTPNGAVFVGRGISFWDNQFQGGVTNAACQPMLTLYPGCNIVRLARVDPTFWTPQTYAQQINWLTALGIVVVIENHRTSNGATGGGGQGQVYSGTLLAQEQAWYSSLATFFKSNPYVWFGTNNEPPIDPSLLALWQWQQTTYNTIRATGNNTIVEIEQYNPYLQGSNSGLSSSFFSSMTNIVFGPHYYSWIWGGNGGTVVPQSTIYNSGIGSTNSQYGGIVQQISTLQTLHSADGVVPIGCFEFGPSTTGTGVDASGMNCVRAVLQAVDNGNLFCYMAWLWGNIGDDNLQDGNGNVSSPYGTTVAADMAPLAGPTPPAQASAVGYNTVTYGPTFKLGNTTDPATSFPTFSNGVNIVPFSFFGTGWQQVGNVQNPDGSITQDGSGQAFGNGMTTGAQGVYRQLPTSFTGTAFGGGFYAEAVMKGVGPMSFWANDLETMNGASLGWGLTPFPGMAQTLTITGSVTGGDTISILMYAPWCNGGAAVNLQFSAAGNTSTMASTIASMINANGALSGVGVSASASGNVVTFNTPAAQEPGIRMNPATIGGAFTADFSVNTYGLGLETDIAEFDFTNDYAWAFHNWHGFTTTDVQADFGGPLSSCPGGGPTCTWIGPTLNGVTVDFTQYHKYGMLWVPATASVPGYVQYYFDGTAISNQMYYNQFNANLPAPPQVGALVNCHGIPYANDHNSMVCQFQPSSAWSILDRRHLVFIFGGSDQGPTTFQSLTVWQRNASGNLIGTGA